MSEYTIAPWVLPPLMVLGLFSTIAFGWLAWRSKDHWDRKQVRENRRMDIFACICMALATVTLAYHWIMNDSMPSLKIARKTIAKMCDKELGS